MKKNFLSGGLVMLLAVLMSLVCTINTANAGPAYPGVITVTQPDGTTLKIRMNGDEHFGWATTEDGKPITRSQDGYFYYANYNSSGAMSVSTQKVSTNKSLSGEKAFLSNFSYPDMKSIAKTISSKSRIQRYQMTKSPSFPSEGNIRSVVILVEFSDVKFSVSDPYNSFYNQLNQEGYAIAGATGSARDYYKANSQDKFVGEFDVYGPYTLDKIQGYYGANDATSGGDNNPQQMIIDAVEKADADGCDFSVYDYNGDGEIDNVFVYYAGYSEAEGGPATSIWPHKWNVESLPVYDGKTLNVYATTSELRGSSGTTIAGIGTFCHEFGHVFGLYDHYDTNDDTDGYSYGLGSYDIMTMGSYNNDGNTPPLFNALEMEMIGWVTPIEFGSSTTEITLEPIQNHTVYKVPTEVEGEYFLIENRSMYSTVWDNYLPNDGLIITHVDLSEPYQYLWDANMPNTNNLHECFRFIMASGSTLGDDNEAEVPYPYNGNDEWTPFSFPKAASWANKLVSHQLTGITKDGQNAKFTVSPVEEYALYGIVYNTELLNPLKLSGVTLTLTPSVMAPTSGMMKMMKSVTSEAMTTTTDASGSYTFPSVSDGTYTIEASYKGYTTYSSEITIEGIGNELNISLYEDYIGDLPTVGYHNNTFGIAIGMDDEMFRPYITLTPEMLRAYVGSSMNYVQFYARTAFEGYIIVQNISNSSTSTGGQGGFGSEVSVASGSTGWKTFDIGGYEIRDSSEYRISIMVTSASTGALPISLDNDESLTYEGYSNMIQIVGDDSSIDQSIYTYSGNTIKGNLMFDAIMSSSSTRLAPSSLTPVSKTVSIPANIRTLMQYNANGGVNESAYNKYCDWTSSNTNIAIVDEWSGVTGISEGTVTITGTSLLNPSVTVSFEVTVTSALPAKATGSIIHLTTREAVSDLEMKFTAVPINDASSSASSAPRYTTAQLLAGEAPAQAPQLSMLKSTGVTSTYATSGSDGVYNVDLTAGYSYIINPNVDEDNGKYYVRYQTTSTTVPYVEGDASTINNFGTFEVYDNAIYGAEKYRYYGDYDVPSFTSATMYTPVMYAIKLSKEDLVDYVGDKFAATDVVFGDMLDSYVEVAVAAYNGYNYEELVLATNESVTAGTTRFTYSYSNYGEILIQPETDYYITAQFIGSLAIDTDNPVVAGKSNLVWDNVSEWVAGTDVGVDAGNWLITTYIQDRPIDPIESISLSVDNASSIYVGVPFTIYTSILPETAVYKNVTWSSSDESVATIDENGLVTFLKESSKVTFTATSETYSDVSSEISLTAKLYQGITGYTITSEGNIIPGASIKFYPTVATQSSVGEMHRITYTRALNAAATELVSDNYGYFMVELAEGTYEVECSYDGLETLYTTVTIGYGLTVQDFYIQSFTQATATYKSWTSAAINDVLSDLGTCMKLYSMWTSDDLKELMGEKITRIHGLVYGTVTVRFTIVDMDNPSGYLYKSDDIVIGDYVSMVGHDIPAASQVTIEDGKTYLVGFELDNYDSEHYPAIVSYVNGKEAAGKGDIMIDDTYNVTSLTEINSMYIGNWVIGFYVQDDETINTFEVTPGQTTATLKWNPQNYDYFRIEYRAEGGDIQAALTEATSYELSSLKANTTYTVSILGSTDGKTYSQMFSGEFTTIPSVVSMPMILVADYTHHVGDVLDLNVINTVSSDTVEWFFDGDTVARGDKVVLNSGKHTITCQVTRGSKTYIAKRVINVE